MLDFLRVRAFLDVGDRDARGRWSSTRWHWRLDGLEGHGRAAERRL